MALLSEVAAGQALPGQVRTLGNRIELEKSG